MFWRSCTTRLCVKNAILKNAFRKRLLLAYVLLTAVITFVYCLMHVPMAIYHETAKMCKEGYIVNDNLTRVIVSISHKTLDEIEYLLGPNLQPGGIFVPPNCTSTSRVAILVPYRDRAEHLRVFLNYMHPFLQKQNIMYGIYIVEIDHESKFNRALLLNVGFVEAMKDFDYSCVVLHDVDLLPEDYRIPYSCPQQPTHLSVSSKRFRYRLPYVDYFGGVSAISTEHYKQINGMSNMFFGWGGEDEDLYRRIRHLNMTITRPAANIARYSMLKHRKDRDVNPLCGCLLNSTTERYAIDGLNSLKYTLRAKAHRTLYTWILIRANSTEIIEENHTLRYFYKSCFQKFHEKKSIAKSLFK